MKINRRKLLSFLGATPAILAGSPALAAPAKKVVQGLGPAKIDALNPKGMPPSVQLVPMAPRLDTLDNKTIYLVSDGFAGADRFLNQIAIWFSKNMPSVKTVYRLKAGGLADDDPALWAEIKKNGNAMIMAYGHCSTCTPATVGHCATIEKMGFPTAPLVTTAFEGLAKTNAASRGMPLERICFLPHPMTTKSDAEMYKVLEGNDPISNKPLMPEVIAALTQPLTADEKKIGSITPDIGPAVYSDTADNLQRYYADNGLTDFMPIVLPTEERVQAMLKGTSHKPDEVVGKLTAAPGAFPEWSFTVRHVAISAVMAGAQPEFLPVILATASTGVTSLFSSTSSFARMLVVNGPIRDQIKMNYGIGAMGPFNDANATIGRAWTLLSKNLGGAGIPGQTYMGSQGTSLNYNNICFAETEDKLPDGWKPAHVQHGFKPDESVVSIYSGWSLNNICFFSSMPIHDVIKNWLTHFFSTGNGSATLLLDPTVAADVARHGFGSKEAYTDYLTKNSKTPAWLYWQNANALKQAQAGVEPYASYLKLGEDTDIPVNRYVARAPYGAPAGGQRSAIEIIVLGGGTNTYWFGGDFAYMASASVDKWR